MPGITLLIGHKPGELRGRVQLGTVFELPDASVNVREAHEGSPVFEHLGLGRRHWHLSDICDEILIVEVIEQELRLVDGVEDVVELALLPNGICAQDVVLLVLSPLHVTHGEVIVLGHLERAFATLF